MKKLYFLSALGIIGFFGTTSCKKYTCTCDVTYYDSSGAYASSTTENHTVKATGIFKAEAKCDSYNESLANVSKTCSVFY